MMLGDPSAAAETDRTTLDALFRRAAMRRPDALALADPPNRSSWTDGEPRRITYAEADRIVTAIAARLRRLGLATDAVVALQLPNTVESVLALLGVLRAGLIAAPLPLLWRRADMVAALGKVGARTIITSGRIGDTEHCTLATQVAAQVFPIRYVCSFGTGLPDGVIPLDDLLEGPLVEPPLPALRTGDPAAHVAVVTFDVTNEGILPVARNHAALIAGGMAVMLEGGIKDDAVILSPVPTHSFGGLAVSLLPWLLSGGTLVLHQPFDPAVLTTQSTDEQCDTLVLPGALLAPMYEAGHLEQPALRRVLALWRAPERLASAPVVAVPSTDVVDVLTFGEIAALPLHRDGDSRASPLPRGALMAPRAAAGAVRVAELSRSDSGTLALRGAMVPRHAFPPGSEPASGPRLKLDGIGFADTGYPCRGDANIGTISITAPPPGLVGIGGYRFALRDLQEHAEMIEPGAGLTALPDSFAGQRLAGHAAERDAVQAAFAAGGFNPLIAGAFRERRKPDVA